MTGELVLNRGFKECQYSCNFLLEGFESNVVDPYAPTSTHQTFFSYQRERSPPMSVLTGEIDRSSTGRVEPVRGCLITQAIWDEPP
jgi:hypothetical protein